MAATASARWGWAVETGRLQWSPVRRHIVAYAGLDESQEGFEEAARSCTVEG